MTQVQRRSTSDHLREDSLSLTQVLFQSVAHMGPAQSVNLALLFGFAFAGPALPLSAALALLAVVLIANCVGQLAKQIPSGGHSWSWSCWSPVAMGCSGVSRCRGCSRTSSASRVPGGSGLWP